MSITTPVLSYLQDASKIAPMLLIEVPTSLGRTYQGYKRGGKTEGRERICEESLAAAVWLFGVKTFNKIGDIFGEKVLGLKDINTDVGRDSLRNPFGYVQDKKKATAIFKFSKIVGSAVLGTIAMGLIVPRIKMAMSNAIRKKDGLEPYPDKFSKDGKPTWADKLVGIFIKGDNRKKLNKDKILSMNEFRNQVSSNDNISFRGAGMNAFLFASHNLENNTIWRLLSTDAGTITGRVKSSRTKKEGIEYLVRDSMSSLFYVFAAPLFSMCLRKFTNTPGINPKAADTTAEYFKNIIKGKEPVRSEYFVSDLMSKELFDKFTSGVNFDKNGVITLEEFLESCPASLKDKAIEMSKLQPEYVGQDGIKRAILSKKQVADIFSDSYTSNPKFLKEAINKATKGKSDDIRAFVSRKRLEKIRDSFDDYTKGLAKYANKKKYGDIISDDVINKYTKGLNRKNLAIHMAGIGFAVFGLSYLIPKIQYYVSEKITGEKGFLGSFDSKEEKSPKAQ